jgi:hypothetical protein
LLCFFALTGGKASARNRIPEAVGQAMDHAERESCNKLLDMHAIQDLLRSIWNRGWRNGRWARLVLRRMHLIMKWGSRRKELKEAEIMLRIMPRLLHLAAR